MGWYKAWARSAVGRGSFVDIVLAVTYSLVFITYDS